MLKLFTTPSDVAARMQDAFNHALFACTDGCFAGHESAFLTRDVRHRRTRRSRIAAVARAKAYAMECGMDFRAPTPRTLAECHEAGQWLAAFIVAACAERGIDAVAGEVAPDPCGLRPGACVGGPSCFYHGSARG